MFTNDIIVNVLMLANEIRFLCPEFLLVVEPLFRLFWLMFISPDLVVLSNFPDGRFHYKKVFYDSDQSDFKFFGKHSRKLWSTESARPQLFLSAKPSHMRPNKWSDCSVNYHYVQIRACWVAIWSDSLRVWDNWIALLWFSITNWTLVV